jgi:hypothetical protein
VSAVAILRRPITDDAAAAAKWWSENAGAERPVNPYPAGDARAPIWDTDFARALLMFTAPEGTEGGA